MILTSDEMIKFFENFVENGGSLWASFRNDIKKFVGAKGIPIITISCMKDTGIDKLKKAIETI